MKTFRVPLLFALILALVIVLWRFLAIAGAAPEAEVDSVSTRSGTPPAAGESGPDPLSGESPGQVDPPHLAVVAAADPDVVLRESMRWDMKGLELVNHPDGRQSMFLQGRFTHMSAAVRDSTGRVVVQCFGGYDELDKAVSGTSPAVSDTSHYHELATY